MTSLVLAAETSTAEAVGFWVLAPVVVLAALGVITGRRPVHAGMLLGLVMLVLAVFYGMQDAQFLMFVQIIVYAGAVMSLFLFVLMIVGIDPVDSLRETIRGQRPAAVVLGIGFAVLLVAGLADAMDGAESTGLADANADGNVFGLARLLFTRYVLVFEVTSALLITAALGAMVLAHRERLTPKSTQLDLMRERFQPGGRPAPLPGPGVFAHTNAVGTPALLPDGSPLPESVPESVARMLAASPERPVLTTPDDEVTR